MGLLSGLFGGNKGTILTESPAGKKQDFLEASPYWDQSTVPVNTFKNKSPYTAKVASRVEITKSFLGDDAAVLEPASPRRRAGVASMACVLDANAP